MVLNPYCALQFIWGTFKQIAFLGPLPKVSDLIGLDWDLGNSNLKKLPDSFVSQSLELLLNMFNGWTNQSCLGGNSAIPSTDVHPHDSTIPLPLKVTPFKKF